MRQWWKMVALGAVAAIAVTTPGAALGGEGDDAPNGTTERVTEWVMEQTQSRFGQPDVAGFGERCADQQRAHLRLQDGTGVNCVGDCDGDQARDKDRDQARDGTGDDCVGDCDGDQARDKDALRQRLQDCEVGCRPAWQFAQRYGWTMQAAI